MRHERTLAQAGNWFLCAEILNSSAFMLGQGRRKISYDKTSQHLPLGVNALCRLQAGATALALISVLFGASETAKAQTWTGAIDSDWTKPGNWNGGVPTTGQTTIATVSPNPTVLGVSGAATGTSGRLFVAGGNSGGPGNLTIQNGSILKSTSGLPSYIGGAAVGQVTVTGSKSEWQIGGYGLTIGGQANGTLTVSNGGSVSMDGYLTLGGQTAPGVVGRLEVTSGGTVTSGFGIITNASGAHGIATVAGSGSKWILTTRSASSLNIFNPGELNIEDQAMVTSHGGTSVAGNLNITNGTLETLFLRGSGLVNFDDGTLRALADNPNFITGFSGAQLNIVSGGLTIDDAGYAIGNDATSIFSGVGGLTKIGSGTFTLLGTNIYTGPTTINTGTLQLDGSITSSATVNATGTLSGIGTVFGGVSNFGNVMPGHGDPSGTLTVTGAYVGNGGNLTINAVLGGNASPTSQLVLSGAGASATGNTNVVVNNVGGTGGQTTGNGIQIVAATGGATTTSSAFTLGNPVFAGLYQYQLGRGTGGTEETNSWYLRSHLQNGPNPPTPIYRPEGAMFASMPSLGRELTRNTIGTFHDYNGDQGLVRGNGAPGRAWGRVFGEAIEQGHAGLLSPNFKGHAYGFQTGADLFETETPSGYKDRFGVFFGYAQTKGEVRGFALGVQNNYVGDSTLEGLSGGAYWTRVGPREEYLEARILGTRYTGDGRSFANNINIDVKGTSFAASLEGGMPLRFGAFTIEPQAQLIYQYLDMTGSDPLSNVGYDTPDALYARVGLRLSSDGLFGWSNVRPFMKANLWQDVVGTDKAIFSATDVVETSFRATALEVGGGVVAQLTQYVGLWGMMDYTTDVSGNQDREIIRGNVGVRIVW